MKPAVYLETTIPSYLTAWRSPELIMAARQQITREWWDGRRDDFDLFVSQLVIDEASSGDPDAAARRMEILDGIPLLEPQEGADGLVQALVRIGYAPQQFYQPDLLLRRVVAVDERGELEVVC